MSYVNYECIEFQFGLDFVLIICTKLEFIEL
ncbi:hypothetical protein T11_4079 [Trichinella zimbabwensis]|uniref:Uncharacterized protein n=1 Tax=Trichinella zimbabwensis TaxID=268475 RepID=A0A0V1FAX2_9BILA|nr:hypothetical protein T11_4079 [Trichinella zimbabwensis]